MLDRLISSRCRIAAVLVTACTLAACGGDDGPTGPSASFDIAGVWQWQMTGATSTTATCTINDVTLSFTRPGGGEALNGHVNAGGNGNVSCVVNGTNNSGNWTSDTGLIGLSLNGSAITWTFRTSTGDWPMTGTVTGDNSISGTGTVIFGPDPAQVLSGPWTATR